MDSRGANAWVSIVVYTCIGYQLGCVNGVVLHLSHRCGLLCALKLSWEHHTHLCASSERSSHTSVFPSVVVVVTFYSGCCVMALEWPVANVDQNPFPSGQMSAWHTQKPTTGTSLSQQRQWRQIDLGAWSNLEVGPPASGFWGKLIGSWWPGGEACTAAAVCALPTLWIKQVRLGYCSSTFGRY